ncbi:MAG: type II toxin-antitoxin system Phd/YefM family antitoxin [Desulfobacterales bacterium]|nr:type II toxin-antitoxin system Phd/YefM family antitoxin [Desulfobacterales bacterium]
MIEESINIAEAKKHFSDLIGQVAFAKKRLLITKRGKPMARLVPVEDAEHRLNEAQGWLENDDPFFDTIENIVSERKNHIPRALSGLKNP